MEENTPTTNDQTATKQQMGCGTQIIAIAIFSLLAWGAYELIMHVAAAN